MKPPYLVEPDRARYWLEKLRVRLFRERLSWMQAQRFRRVRK